MKKIILSCAILSVFVIGCNTYPVTNVSTVDSRPTLSFTGAPEGSLLLVDGINMGAVSQYNGNPKVLTVQPGTHEVTVMINNKIVSQQTVFVENEHKVISIH
jgi:hypothetical protein